jgi:hypothetical protein
MENGICNFPLVACRKEANERSEMVTQLLYGESYIVLEDTGDWLRIKINRDDYEAWMDKKLHTEYTESTESLYPVLRPFFNFTNDKSQELVLPGAALIKVKQKEESDFSIVTTALAYLDAPYLWGGKSIWGLDCSGFTQAVFQIHGINILRDAYLQAEEGEAVEFNNLIEPGDLAFFAKADEKIYHVGICLDDERIIHASGKVRFDKLDHLGIYNKDLQKYTHELRLIKRIKKATA